MADDAQDVVDDDHVADPVAGPAPSLSIIAGVAAAALTLEACGGSPSPGASITAAATAPVITPAFRTTELGASRFLAQATMGATSESIARVRSQGFDGWLTEQLAMPRSQALWDWLVAGGYNVTGSMNNQSGFDPAVWSQLITAPDQLRQRVGMALLDFLVVGISGIPGNFAQFSMAAYIDVLMDNGFGNYRTLLDQITTNAAMGAFLTFVNNRRADARSGAVPDENYARELMQLFTIGLNELNLDGSLRLAAGAPIETYTPDDISGLARVWTGWTLDSTDATTPERYRRPMVNTAAHETGAKVFLGRTIPAGTSGADSKTIALDTIFAHANLAPFVSKQLIQRLVTSNPSPAYVGRVAAVFANNGSGVRGDMKAIIRAILLDSEARDDAGAAASANFGKVRDPVLRLTGWARAFGATSPSGAWAIGDTSSVTRLAQSPGRSTSVFGFFRPGYTPPNTPIADAGLVAPELQLANETTVIGYVNYMQTVVSTGVGDVRGNYADLVAIAANAPALIDRVNLVLAAGQVSAATIMRIRAAVESFGAVTPADLANRVSASVLLILASPEYLVQK